MRRIAPLALVLLVLVPAACSGGDEPPATASPSPTPDRSPSLTPDPGGSASPSPHPPPSPSASPTPWTVPDTVRVPADAPTTVDDQGAVDAVQGGDLAPLAPPGSEITRSAVLIAVDDRVDQVALTWRRGDDPFGAEHGFVVWQRFRDDPAWRAVYAFTDRPRQGVLGVRLDAGDLTGDATTLDALTFEQQGGSGVCGIWRVVVSSPGAADEVFRRATCDTEIRIARGGLSIREAVFAPEDPHCCPSQIRASRLEWDGETFVEVSSQLVDLR